MKIFLGVGLSTLLFFVSLIASVAAPIVPAGQSFTCTPTHVWDGDGPIWCKEGPRVRLAGVAAREINETCKRNHPCPKSSGRAARDALVMLVGKPTGKISRHGHILVIGSSMRCHSNGSAGGNRTAAWCVSPKSGDVNCAITRGGWALRWKRYWKEHQCLE